MSTTPEIQNDEAKFKRYLVREFFWELAQHEPVPAAFSGLSQDAVEVLTFQGYDGMRVRVVDKTYDIRLSWRRDTVPAIQEAP